MKNNSIFRLENQFNYKNINCYIGFHIDGHRIAGVEIPAIPNFPVEQIEDYCNCDYTYEEDGIFYIENDFGHFHNSYDIEGYKESWGEDNDEVIDKMTRWNKAIGNLPHTEGSLELAKENCKKIVDILIAKGVISNRN